PGRQWVSSCSLRCLDADSLDHAVAERRTVGHGVEGGDAELAGNDLNTYLVVRRRPGDHTRLDPEALAQEFHATPGGYRIVGRQDDARQRGPNIRAFEDGVHAVRTENAITQLEDDRVGLASG